MIVRIIFTLAIFLSSLRLYAVNDEVRNGGDHVRIAFKEGAHLAVEQLKAFKIEDLDPEISAGSRLWLESNALKLAADLEMSDLVWVEDLPDNCSAHTCACTGLNPKSPIYLSSKQCNVRFIDRQYTAKLLIHESVHHFNVSDEALADEVAIAVMAPREPPGRLYASLGHPVKAQVISDSKNTTLHDNHSISLFSQSGGSRQVNKGFGIGYEYIFNKWSVNTKYSQTQIERDDIYQLISLGSKYLLSTKGVQPYALMNLGYGFTSYENEDLNGNSSIQYASKDIGLGLGLQYFVWSNSKILVESERVLVGLSSYDDTFYVPASKWLLRLGVGVSY